MKFKYKAYGDNLRPVIPVILINGGKYLRHEVLVDSGSDHCFIDAEIGSFLGITKENSEVHEVAGVGGKRSAYYKHEITMVIGGKSFRVSVGSMKNLGGEAFTYGIVGQKGFFDKFTVKFDLSKEELELKEKRS